MNNIPVPSISQPAPANRSSGNPALDAAELGVEAVHYSVSSTIPEFQKVVDVAPAVDEVSRTVVETIDVAEPLGILDGALDTALDVISGVADIF